MKPALYFIPLRGGRVCHFGGYF